MLLEAKNLDVCYGAVRALEDVSFCLSSGEIVAMIGPNGAGKSTSLKAVGGLIDSYGGHIVMGQVFLDGHDITNQSANKLARMGLAVVPEGRRVFPTMTVKENLEMGAYLTDDRHRVGDGMDRVFSIFAPLKGFVNRRAGSLSGGEQQMLAIGRALMMEPTVLMTDEPSLGLSPNFVDVIFDKLVEINKAGTAILLVEQNVSMALQIAHRGYVFDIGKIAIEGTAKSLLENMDIRRVYFGDPGKAI